VTGVVDLRQAGTWFAIPTGDVQGDIAVMPRSIVIDYATFQRQLLPALRATLGTTTPVLNSSLTDLPPVDVEAHITVDHRGYPSDPARAVVWTGGLQHLLERQAPGSIVVSDQAAEPLTLAQADATNAKILFLLLGIPGLLAAAALGLASESALAEAHRREEALLRLRGASDAQLVRATAAQAVLAGLLGAVLGLVVAGAAVSAVDGRAVWHDAPAGRLAVSLSLAVGAGAVIVLLRLIRLVRAGKRSEVTAERRLLERGWAPAWRRHRLDLAAIGIGVAILLVTLLTGGLKQTQVEGTSLALSFYVLLAPIALWLGISLLAIRGLLGAFGRWARPERARPLGTWREAALRWLGRRPARTAVALVLGTLAVAFGTNVVAFVGTYRAAKHADARAAFGSDLHVTPATELPVPLPKLGPGVAATTPVVTIPVRAGTDRKTALAIDPATYPRAITDSIRLSSGQGIDALVHNPSAVLVSQEIVQLFAVRVGDPLPLTVFPDDEEKSRNMTLRVAGIYRSAPPTEPPTELIVSARRFPPWLLPVPDFFLARVAPGRTPAAVAKELQSSQVGRSFQVTTIHDRSRWTPRSLAALNLGGLSQIEAAGAALIAAIGVAVLGAFVVLERRREFAVLRTLGAETSQQLTAPAQEGLIAVAGSILLGVPIGLGLGLLAVRVLGLFFTLPPPLLSVPGWPLAAFVLLVAGVSALALGGALVAVSRVRTAAVLREP
jgi:putative ABC transport system permease protein